MSVELPNALSTIRCFISVYEKVGEGVREKYGITQTELDIIAFLVNNPGRDTASDIVEYRKLPKANVSQAVESMIHKELLLRDQDLQDRRKIHLTLTEKGRAIFPDIQESRKLLVDVLFRDFNQEELQIFAEMNSRIAKNALDYLERK